MKIENLEKGNDLKKKIENIENQIQKWEGAKSIYNISLSKSVNSWDTKNQDFNHIETYPIDFEVLKTLALKKLNDKLSDLKKEFENL